MGKVVPPEFSTGAVVSFILLVFSGMPLSVSLLMGLFSSLAMIPVFELKIRLNRIMGRRFDYKTAVILSIFISFFIYLFLQIFFLYASPLIKSQLSFDSKLVVFSFLTLPFFYAIRLKSRNEPRYFILGIAFGGMLTWINLFYF
jgi:hypothetical protein